MKQTFVLDFSHRALIPYAHDYQHGEHEPWHSHPCDQLIHTLSGVIRVETEQGIWIVPPGRGVWIPAQVVHTLFIEGDVQARGVFVEPLARADLPVVCQVVRVNDLLRALMVEALRLDERYQPGSRAERIYELILDEIRLMNTLPFCLPEPTSARLKPLCDAIRQTPTQAWTLEHAARQVNMSGRTLARHFYQQTGLQFSEWVRRARLLIALTRLASGEPVTQVALECGYATPSAFSAMFRRVMGVPPGDYFTQ